MKKRIARIIAAFVAFVLLAIITHIIELPLYVSLPLYIVLYAFIGWDVAYRAIRGIFNGMLTDENFLMLVATVGAFIVGELSEAVAVILFYQTGELLQDAAVGKSRRSIAQLMELRPEKARLLKNGTEIEVNPESVEAGDIVLVKTGERVPVDGIIQSGQSALDLSMLTGESVPTSVSVGSEALSGAINLSGALEIKATCAYESSTAARIMELVEKSAGQKAKTESVISRFAAVYTPIVMICALLLALVPSLITGNWSVWTYRALTFLVVSCPCALVISVPLAFFGAIGGASRMGVLIKGGTFVEALSKTDVLLTDKTGTLTKGAFEVKRVEPAENREQILAVAAVAESRSLHPIARAISMAAPKIDVSGYVVKEQAGKGVSATREDDEIIVGSIVWLEENGISVEKSEIDGNAIYVARNRKYLGAIEVGDEIKPNAKHTIAALKAHGIRTVMLTGDEERVAKEVASRVGIDEYHAGLLPDGKIRVAEKYLNRKKKTAFVGDGINDAPVLMRADLGIAMGALGSDSAIEAADIVLMNDDLSSITRALQLAKKTMRIVRFNVAASLAVKIAVMVLSSFGLVGMWAAIIADVGVMCLAVLNSLRTLRKVK